MSNVYFKHECGNGLTLLMEPRPEGTVGAYSLLLPAGVAREPAPNLGIANLLSEWVTRGAGTRDSRALTLALDSLGLQRHESAEIFHTVFGGATLARNLLPALEMVADMVRRPHLAEEHLDYCKASAIQEIEAIEDEPTQKLFIELRQRTLADPLGRSVLGSLEGVENLAHQDVRMFHQQRYQPQQAILAVAGPMDFGEVRAAVERLFGDWQPHALETLQAGPRVPSHHHLPADKVQTHIGVAFDSVSANDPDYYNAHGAVGVLSGGMSARLFTEVREKRGLCYSVGASYLPLKDRGLIIAYAGTTADRAAETLEVLLAELDRLRQGISPSEVQRVQAGLKSSLIMGEESTAARAAVLARSWFNLGRVRTLEEVAQEIDRLTPVSILGYLERHPAGKYSIMTLGPAPLNIA